MICSVYDTHRRCYDYYEVPGTAKDYGSRGQKYRAPTQSPQGSTACGAIGFAPEALALPLPTNAQHVGTGEHAKGIICTPGNRALAPLGAVMPMNVTDLALTGLAGLGETQIVEVEKKHSWSHIIAAAAVAGTVGVLVQRALGAGAKKRRRR